MKRLMAAVQTAGYHSDSDPDYEPGDEVEVVTRPRTGSETQADTSFNGSTGASSVLNRYMISSSPSPPLMSSYSVQDRPEQEEQHGHQHCLHHQVRL